MVTDNLITNPITDNRIKHRAIPNIHSRRWMGNILVAVDMLSLLIAIFIALLARFRIFGSIDSPYSGIFLILGATIAYLFLRRGLYPPVGMHYADELKHIITSVTLAFLIMVAVTFVFKDTLSYSRLVLGFTWLLCLPLIPFNRYIVRRLLIRLGLWGESVMIVGDLKKAKALAEYFKAKLQYGLLPVAVLSDKHHTADLVGDGLVLPISRIKLIARNLSVKTVLIVIEDLNAMESTIIHYRGTFQWMILIKDKFDNYGMTFLKPLDFMDVLGLQVKNNLLSGSAQLPKRIMDVIWSILGLVFLSPFLALIALLIRLESGGDVFYRQHRLGKNGQDFNLLKFRTMHHNAAVVLKEELARDPQLKREWDKYQKLRYDPRITRVGGFLRKFSFDELPQLWNVLKGEMSLVGPRPILVDQSELYGESFKEYINVSPGITGLWQVNGRSETTFARRAELDLEYIQRWSPWLDIYILFKTVKIVLWQQGAY